jgi:hypothetical protein
MICLFAVKKSLFNLVFRAGNQYLLLTNISNRYDKLCCAHDVHRKNICTHIERSFIPYIQCINI